MASILPFIPAGADFDPEALVIIGAAFDKARAMLNGREHAGVAIDAVARQIITLANGGEHNADRLCERALTIFGLQLPRTAA
ncbi:MAG TPA: hypothetical protein VFT69_15590 [Pseudolabrys sp.]|jgi:hypothetical protein|nr:hypothetical protein [Pseudolabrys sp.]